MNPLITIGIPTYKRLEYLREAVASALAQTYSPIEVLISDDGPGNEIGAWSKELAAKDPRVIYRKNPRNLGLAGNWNAVADSARGEWLMMIGDDDRLLPECIATLTSLARPELSMVFSNHHLIDERGNRLVEASREHTSTYSRDQLKPGILSDPEMWVWRNAIPICSSLVRTSDAGRLRFKEDLNTPEIEWFLRLAREGRAFAFTPEYLVEYRSHSQSATAAGLWGEKLAEYLLPMAVTPELEPWKRRFMSNLLPGAVTRCLLQGDTARARELLQSSYYPQNGPLANKRTLQQVCTMMPGGTGLYRLLFSLRHKGLATHRPPPVF